MLERIIYISRESNKLSKMEMKLLLYDAREKNLKQEITGFLIYQKGFFIQWFEGPKPNTEKLLNSLLNDERHYDLKILKRNKVKERQFREWSMLYRFNLEDWADKDLEELIASTERDENRTAFLRKTLAYIKEMGYSNISPFFKG